MRKLFFSGLVAVAAIGSAFVSDAKVSNTNSKSLTIFTYYDPSASCAAITCDDSALGAACSTVYGSTLPIQFNSTSSCTNSQTVQGNLPL